MTTLIQEIEKLDNEIILWHGSGRRIVVKKDDVQSLIKQAIEKIELKRDKGKPKPMKKLRAGARTISRLSYTFGYVDAMNDAIKILGKEDSHV